MPDFADAFTSTRGLGALLGTAYAASSSGTVQVSVGGQVVTCRTTRGLSVAANDLVLLQRVGSMYVVVDKVYESAVTLPDPGDPTYPEAAPDVRPSTVTGTFVLHPVDTGTYNATTGWREDTTDLFQGDQSGSGQLTGAAFYGTKPEALAGATVTAARVKLRRLAGGAYAAASATLKLVTESTRPFGAPTLSSSLAATSLAIGDEADVDIGTTWGQALVDGTAGGLAINVATATPYLRLAGRDSWSAGMAVAIDWRR